MRRLENRVAIVTGGATGLGKVYALRLASEGAAVCIWDIDSAGAEKTASMIEEKEGKAIASKVDVTSEEETFVAAKAAFDAFHRIDILVNNAGLVRDDMLRVPIEELKPADWNRVINVNLTGMFLVSRAVIPYMKRSGKGKIINISSGVALHGSLARQDYVASKAGVIGLTRALAVDLGEYNINVNAVTPGPVETAEARGEQPRSIPEDILERILAGRYIKRLTYPRDLEGVIAFLASDESDMITGQVVNVDGGRVFIG